MKGLFIGVMSGTSLDGADAGLVDFSGERPRTVGFTSVAFPASLRQRLLSLSHPGHDSIEDAGVASVELAQIYASAVSRLLEEAGARSSDVTAIGCHGQTVRHRPDLRFTTQLNDAALLAEHTGIDVVADFRRRDMAAGGQGAPLVPAFHDAIFRRNDRSVAVVNIGGISNVTSLAPGAPTLGFDCGPGNVLLDGWIKQHLGREYDENGSWASSGRIDNALLERLMQEPFLRMPPPKSTGRELFHMDWLRGHGVEALEPADVQRTLVEFTALAIVRSIGAFCPGTDEIYLCGGGARNPVLLQRTRALAGRPVEATDALGVPSGHVEAMAFAWLAMKCVRREAIDMSTITGARGPRVLGCIYPA